MNLEAATDLMRDYGVIEVTTLPGGALYFASSFRPRTASLEFVRGRQGELVCVAIADVLSVEYGTTPEEQAEGARVLSGVVTNGLLEVARGRQRWLVIGGSAGELDERDRLLRSWLPWASGLATPIGVVRLRLA